MMGNTGSVSGGTWFGSGVQLYSGNPNLYIADPNPSISSLQQYKSDATTTIGEGSSTTESYVVFTALLNSSSTTSTLKLQVEVEPSTIDFTRTVTVSSTFVS